MLLGAHVSIAGGVHNAVDHGVALGCDVIQIFTKNQRQWDAKPYASADVETYRAKYAASGLKGSVAHAGYLINLASPDDALWKRSWEALADEARRCDQLGVPELVVHPGAHVGSGAEAGVKRIAEGLTHVLAASEKVRIDLECMAGQGSTIGDRWQDLGNILERSAEKKRLGVCLDTCHMFAAGHDLTTPEAYAATMKAVDTSVGLRRVGAFHLNDSKGPLGCRRDRHDDIGAGHIGKAGFSLLMNDERFAHVPMNLETPSEEPGYANNLKVLRGLIGTTVKPGRGTLRGFSTA